jgi:acetylornithine deacetylase/succinyl-diaminopimelate desuccinylase-like protein
MASLFARAVDNPIEPIAQDLRVSRAIDWLAKNLDWVTAEQIRITEIPAPEFSEGLRGEYIHKLFESAGLKAKTDATGNVIGERPGADSKSVVLVAAHMDTVFPAGTDVRVKHNGARLEAPGIADNGAGLAALVAVARALREGQVSTGMTLVFAADVGEEGEGNLRGIRKLVEDYRSRLRAVIAIDGASTDHITTMALASRRIEATVSGPGGHSWSDFGEPNPITALARAIVRFSAVSPPDEPRTTFNVGVMEGGTSVNSIPFRAAIKVDLRSESEGQLETLEAALRGAIQAGIDEEIAAARTRDGSLEAKFKVLGIRPGGQLPPDAPLLEATRNVDRYLGNRARLERSSTDANVPLSLGIPAIAVGGGGRGGGSHSLTEWYDPTDRDLGVKRILLTLLAVAGVQP